MPPRIPVTVLGATGVVGQRFVRRLAQHPWFEIKHLTASEKNIGRAYGEACSWRLDGVPHREFGAMKLAASDPKSAPAPIVFSALDTDAAREIEPLFAAAGSFVFSNASAFRMADDVPLLVPEVNPDHLQMIEVQQKNRGWKGAIITNPNCTATVLVMALAPLQQAFGIETVMMTSMQAVSGAGYPGVASLDILGNIVPYIKNEEPKVEEETPKMLGGFDGRSFTPAKMIVSALCHRVPVLEGHTEAVSVKLGGNPTPDRVRDVMRSWTSEPQLRELPSAPEMPIRMHLDEDRPQVRRDVEADNGMSVHVGRIRPCPVLGIKFSLLGHNTERGAAGASILNAELAYARGYFSR